jgi:heme/copper-type cytochrome/quinol oxidase subunit 1
VAIALLSFGVWAHHMFTVGLGHADGFVLCRLDDAHRDSHGREGAQLERHAVSAGASASRRRCSSASRSSSSFSAAASRGISHAIVPLDWQTKNSYYLVAHFHLCRGRRHPLRNPGRVHYWFPKMSGRMLSEKLGSGRSG